MHTTLKIEFPSLEQLPRLEQIVAPFPSLESRVSRTDSCSSQQPLTGTPNSHQSPRLPSIPLILWYAIFSFQQLFDNVFSIFQFECEFDLFLFSVKEFGFFHLFLIAGSIIFLCFEFEIELCSSLEILGFVYDEIKNVSTSISWTI